MARRVLVVDDDPLSRELFKRILRDANTEVAEASDGAEALALLASGFFDLVVADLAMPSMSGMQLIRIVRRAGLATPFLVVSGSQSPVLDIWTREFALTAVLRKPVSTEALREAAAKLLEVAHREAGNLPS